MCVASRNPPARRWQALPPRSCRRPAMREPSFDAGNAALAPKIEVLDSKMPVGETALVFVDHAAAPNPDKPMDIGG